MKIRQLLDYLEEIAPLSYQESYDNSGLIVGNASLNITGVLLCLDSVESVLDEAIEKGCNLIIAHHPIVFSGLKRFNGNNYVERVVIKAIKHDIAIYACHTNLDNVHQGVNAKICEKIGLINTQILAPKAVWKKLNVYLSTDAVDSLRNTLLKIGAGQFDDKINVSYTGIGAGTTGNKMNAQAHLEVQFPKAIESKIYQALHKLGENIHFDISEIENRYAQIGSGMIGELEKPMAPKLFLSTLKKQMNIGCIRYTAINGKKIQRVAVCGGAGGFLLKAAIRQRADVFVTADYKYHEFFDADGRIIIADIGHYESEQYTIELFHELITQKFSTFGVYLTSQNTNPINYL